MTQRKQNGSWLYDFTLTGHGRQRKSGFLSRAEAAAAEKQARIDLLEGRKRTTLDGAFNAYLSATPMKDRSRESALRHWRDVSPILGTTFIEDVDTVAVDRLRASIPAHLGPKSVNHRLSLVRTVLRFMWTRGRLASVPFVPTLRVPDSHQDWYTEAERDLLLDGIFARFPAWYAFFYVTTRLGLRRGEVYAIAHDRIRGDRLIVDRAVQEGRGERRARLVPRKNNRMVTLMLPPDVIDAIRWHVERGYAGPEFLFSSDGTWPHKLNGHAKVLRHVQDELGLRRLGHHRIGRHSVASQAATGGHSIKTIQAQLGHRSESSTHRYSHLGNVAQLRLVEGLRPEKPPHMEVG